MDWVGLGHRVDGLDWIGFRKLDARPTLYWLQYVRRVSKDVRSLCNTD